MEKEGGSIISKYWQPLCSLALSAFTLGMTNQQLHEMQADVDHFKQINPDVLKTLIDRNSADLEQTRREMREAVDALHQDLQQLHSDTSYIRGQIAKGDTP